MTRKHRAFAAGLSLLLLAFTTACNSPSPAVKDAAGSGVKHDLMRDGKATALIVVKEDAAPPLQFAARELSSFLAKISDGEAPDIANAADPDQDWVFLKTVEGGDVVAAARVKPAAL